MATEITMPQLGLTMTEGAVSLWLKHVGDLVKAGEPLFEVQTDKITYTAEAPVAGVLAEIRVPENQVVPVGTVIGVIEEKAGATPPAAPPAKPAPTAAPAPTTVPSSRLTPNAQPASPPAPEQASGERIFASPKARRIAQERNLDLRTITGTGPGGRIKSRDLPAAAPAVEHVLATPVARRMAEEIGIDLSKVKGTGPGGRITQDDVRRVAPPLPAVPPGSATPREPMVVVSPANVKKQMAQRMAQAKREIPHFYETIDVEGTALVARKNAEAPRLAAQNIRLTYTALLVEAVAKVLAEFPLLNARWDAQQNQAVLNPHLNIGVATALDDGLIVPVIHAVEMKSLAGIASELQRLAAATEAKRYRFADLEGATFTLSNLGMTGITMVYPIINPPQCAILGVGALQERLSVREGTIRIVPMMTLVLAADHRICDGMYAARFLARLREVLEEK